MNSNTTENSEVVSLKSGFIRQFVNPKVTLFTLTVIPNFVLLYYSRPVQILGKKELILFKELIGYNSQLKRNILNLSKAILNHEDDVLCSELRIQVAESVS
ncbi:hypothetical protein [Fusibacter sp. 3D3]|uniref:hypothetical protein n=1 Tax=Fusibacter sp. 3D3 TaxID=1048380 RepID=UPI001A9A5F1C|nr:hypothetical protein [Fusibacter sp. 3D3]